MAGSGSLARLFSSVFFYFIFILFFAYRLPAALLPYILQLSSRRHTAAMNEDSGSIVSMNYWALVVRLEATLYSICFAAAFRLPRCWPAFPLTDPIQLARRKKRSASAAQYISAELYPAPAIMFASNHQSHFQFPFLPDSDSGCEPQQIVLIGWFCVCKEMCIPPNKVAHDCNNL